MLLREVEYARPETVDEAVRLLSSREDARALAGGQSLVNVMKTRVAAPELLVDLNRIDELREISTGAGGSLVLGAMVTYDELIRSDGGARSRGRSWPRLRSRSPTCRCETAARSAATSASTTRRTTCRR